MQFLEGGGGGGGGHLPQMPHPGSATAMCMCTGWMITLQSQASEHNKENIRL